MPNVRLFVIIATISVTSMILGSIAGNPFIQKAHAQSEAMGRNGVAECFVDGKKKWAEPITSARVENGVVRVFFPPENGWNSAYLTGTCIVYTNQATK